MQNCPHFTILNYLLFSYILCFCAFVLLCFCVFMFLCFCVFCVFLSFLCFLSFLSFWLFVFLSKHHSDQMSEESQVSKITLCVKIQKWHSATHWPRSGIELPGQLKKHSKCMIFCDFHLLCLDFSMFGPKKVQLLLLNYSIE